MRKSTNEQNNPSIPIATRQPFSSRRQSQLINVRDAILDIIDWFSDSLSRQNVTASVDAAETIQLSADPDMFRSALLNLCRNAVNSMPNGGELVFTVYADARAVEIEVADSRSDFLPSGDRAIIPFPTRYSGQASYEGVVHAVRFIETHGGYMSMQNCPEGGVAFTLHLPTARAVRAAA